jgi:lactate racemase
LTIDSLIVFHYFIEKGKPMLYKFPYKDIMPIEIPESHLVDVYSVRTIDSLQEAPEVIITKSLKEPIGMPRISQMINANSRILIIIDDMSRPTPAYQIIPSLLEELALGNVRDINVRFLVALGTHRPMTKQEIEAKVGAAVAERFLVINHEWDNPKELYDYGTLDDGTHVVLNRAMHESDFVIGIGSIAPHPAAGYSGGSKIIAPGVATEEAVGEFHWQSVHYAQKDVLGVRENPMRERIDKMANLAGLKAIVNVILDGEGKIVRCFTGDPVKAHRAGSEWAGEIYRVKVNKPETADIFIIDTHPLDQDLWQGVKAMCALECIVPDGAVVIVVTPCPEGVSRQHPDVLTLGYLSLADTTNHVLSGKLDKVTAHNIVQGGKLVKRTQAFMVSPGIPAEEIRRLGFQPFDSAQDALNEAIRRKGTTARVIILKMGGEICPLTE